jgi:DNA-binding response OmpR family regulator
MAAHNRSSETRLMRILIVEDDRQLSEVLSEALGSQYQVEVVTDGEQAWQWLTSLGFDLVLLDVTLPKIDGLRLCQRLRNREASPNLTTPVMLLTARDTIADKILGLDAGADDYVTKPFDVGELMARVRALLRRGGIAEVRPLQWGDLQLISATHEASYNDQPLSLTPKEYALLELLISNGRRILSRSAIIEQVWSLDSSPAEETITSHMRGLRQKLRHLGAPDDFIETVHGVGYRLKTP